jgi:peptide subunit release factor 1 (eRF1)
MCLIVDANVASLVFTSDPPKEFNPVTNALLRGEAVAIYGGQLTREYLKLGPVRRFLVALDRAGRAKQLPENQIDTEAAKLASERACQSNDHHIIAIARIGHVRLLCSHDEALHADFTNKTLLDDPRGSVYQNDAHKHLLRKHCEHK